MCEPFPAALRQDRNKPNQRASFSRVVSPCHLVWGGASAFVSAHQQRKRFSAIGTLWEMKLFMRQDLSAQHISLS